MNQNISHFIQVFHNLEMPQANQLHYKYDFSNAEDVYQLLTLGLLDFDEYMLPFILKGFHWNEVKQEFIFTVCTMDIAFLAYLHNYAIAYYGLAFIKYWLQYENSFEVNKVSSYIAKRRFNIIIEKHDIESVINENFLSHYIAPHILDYYNLEQKKLLAHYLNIILLEQVKYEGEVCCEHEIDAFNDYWKEYLD